jgi:hypothetical protein
MADELLSPEERRRQAALRVMERFADEHGATNRTWEELDEGDVIRLVGTTDGGRRFHVGYQKLSPMEVFELGVRFAEAR